MLGLGRLATYTWRLRKGEVKGEGRPASLLCLLGYVLFILYNVHTTVHKPPGRAYRQLTAPTKRQRGRMVFPSPILNTMELQRKVLIKELACDCEIKLPPLQHRRIETPEHRVTENLFSLSLRLPPLSLSFSLPFTAHDSYPRAIHLFNGGAREGSEVGIDLYCTVDSPHTRWFSSS